MPQTPVPAEWFERVNAFKEFTSSRELAEAHPPPHEMSSGGVGIWYYPLGVVGGTLYSIHVAVSGDNAPMAYMHTEPSEAPNTVVASTRPCWRFW